MRKAVLSFVVHAGTSTQTVTGVEDADGPFVADLFLFQSGIQFLDSLAVDTYPWYADFRGIDTGAIRSASAVADVYSPFNFKGVSGATSLGDHSLLDMFTDNFGTVSIQRKAKIAAIRSGEFDVSFDTNARSGDSILVLALADIDFTFTNVTNGTHSTVSKPQGFLAMPTPAPASSGPTSGGTGGGNIPWGFATRDGVYGASTLNVVNQASNWIVQRTDSWAAEVDATGALNANHPTVSAWGDTSITIANNAGGIGAQPIVFCGDDVRCAGGSFTQLTTDGTQVIDLGIAAEVIFFFSVGAVASDDPVDPIGQQVTGWSTGSTQQVGWWTGEKTPGNVSPAYGARYVTASSVLRFAIPNAGSTVFNSIASLTDLSAEDGTATLEWTDTDSTERQILWFAIGTEIVPPPPPPTPVYRTREVVRRRLRRAPIVWSEKGGLQTRVKINLFAVDMQPGVGTSDTPDPLVMIRASKDGGFTWGNERMLTAGRVGEYFNRINAWQWGQGRDWVFEVSCTDPVLWNLVGAYLDAEGGNN